MGNAYMNKVDGPYAAFYNPAGLGSVRKFNFHLTSLHLEVNKGFINLTEGSAFDTIGKITDNFSAQGLRDNLVNSPGNLSHAKFNLYPNFTTRYLTLGYMLSLSNRAKMDSASSDIEFAQRRDHGPVLGLNFSLFGGVLKFGASAVYLNRKQVQKDFTINQDAEVLSSDYTFGRGLIVTAGSRLTLPLALLPTFSFIARNLGESEFDDYKDGNVAPETIKQTFDAGFSITPQIGKKTRVHIEVNLKDLTNEYDDTDSSRKIMGGIEFDFARTYFLRFGYGDAYGSGGIGVRTRRFHFDLSTYAVDLGQKGIREIEDRRFVFSLSSGI
jgi:hypothetical protein